MAIETRCLRVSRARIGGELIEKLVSAQLVGIFRIEIGKERIEVVASTALVGFTSPNNGTAHGNGSGRVRIAYVGRKRVALSNSVRSTSPSARWSSLFRVGRFACFITPPSIHEFAIVAIAHVIACQVIPKKPRRRIVDIRLLCWRGYSSATWP